MPVPKRVVVGRRKGTENAWAQAAFRTALEIRAARITRPQHVRLKSAVLINTTSISVQMENASRKDGCVMETMIVGTMMMKADLSVQTTFARVTRWH